jgi:hypothetical protein
LAVLVGLFLCAPAQAAGLRQEQARTSIARSEARYAEQAGTGTTRIGACHRLDRTTIRCQVLVLMSVVSVNDTPLPPQVCGWFDIARRHPRFAASRFQKPGKASFWFGGPRS